MFCSVSRKEERLRNTSEKTWKHWTSAVHEPALESNNSSIPSSLFNQHQDTLPFFNGWVFFRENMRIQERYWWMKRSALSSKMMDDGWCWSSWVCHDPSDNWCQKRVMLSSLVALSGKPNSPNDNGSVIIFSFFFSLSTRKNVAWWKSLFWIPFLQTMT